MSCRWPREVRAGAPGLVRMGVRATRRYISTRRIPVHVLVPPLGPVPLTGADVRLRVVSLADATRLMRACGARLDDPVVFGPCALVPRVWPQWVRSVWRLRRLAHDGNTYPYVIERGGAPVGELLARLDYGTATAELSLWLNDHAYDGELIGAALTMLIDLLQTRYPGLRRLCMHPKARDELVIGILRDFGFELEGSAFARVTDGSAHLDDRRELWTFLPASR